KLDLAGAIELVEYVRVGLARERTDDLAHSAGFQEGSQADLAVAGVVVDDDEIFGAVGDKPVDKFGRLACTAEAANHDGGAVVDLGKRLLDRRRDFIDHVCSTNIPLNIGCFVLIMNCYSNVELFLLRIVTRVPLVNDSGSTRLPDFLRFSINSRDAIPN